MKYLFMIDGAAGTGKTDLVTYVSSTFQASGTATIVRKLTTRLQRPDEIRRAAKLDLTFVNDDQFDENARSTSAYTYEYAGFRYGFLKTDVNAALARFDCVFVIARNLDIIRRLRVDYPDIYTIAVYVHSDREEIRQRLINDGYDEEAIEFRLGRQQLVWDDYLKHPEVYDEVIINNSARNDFQRLIERLIHKHTHPPPHVLPVSPRHPSSLPKALVGHRDAMLDQMSRYPYDRNIFLMMRFRDSNRLLFEFIAEQVQRRGFRCVRADQPLWDITSDVYNPIAVLHCCKYGIALFDEPEQSNTFSPNVAYELGMMHLQCKRCLILRHTSLPEMPFDLIKDLHTRYTRELELKEIVVDWLDSIAQKTDGTG